jgi:hypothetical protein
MNFALKQIFRPLVSALRVVGVGLRVGIKDRGEDRIRTTCLHTADGSYGLSSNAPGTSPPNSSGLKSEKCDRMD